MTSSMGSTSTSSSMASRTIRGSWTWSGRNNWRESKRIRGRVMPQTLIGNKAESERKNELYAKRTDDDHCGARDSRWRYRLLRNRDIDGCGHGCKTHQCP